MGGRAKQKTTSYNRQVIGKMPRQFPAVIVDKSARLSKPTAEEDLDEAQRLRKSSQFLHGVMGTFVIKKSED